MTQVKSASLRHTHAAAGASRPWHGAAFVVEALVLLLFIVASLTVLTNLMASAHERSGQAGNLSLAVILASNDAEAFAADPNEMSVEEAATEVHLFASVDGELVQISAQEAADRQAEGTGDTVFQVQRTVQADTRAAGTLYEAHITVTSLDGSTSYELDTSHYVPNEEVA